MFYDEFLKLCESVGKKPGGVAKELGIARATVSCWKSRGVLPSANTLKMLCEYFDVGAEVFLGKTIEPEDRTKVETEVALKFNQLSPEAQQEVIKFMDFKISLESMKKDSGN